MGRPANINERMRNMPQQNIRKVVPLQQPITVAVRPNA
jgi:hypothetical protein